MISTTSGGLSKRSGITKLLTDFGYKYSASTWAEWGRVPMSAFPEAFKNAVQAAPEIDFLLSVPIRGGVPASINVTGEVNRIRKLVEAGVNPLSTSGNITSWELYQLSMNPEWLAKTKFFEKVGFDQYVEVPAAGIFGSR